MDLDLKADEFVQIRIHPVFGVSYLVFCLKYRELLLIGKMLHCDFDMLGWIASKYDITVLLQAFTKR